MRSVIHSVVNQGSEGLSRNQVLYEPAGIDERLDIILICKVAMGCR